MSGRRPLQNARVDQLEGLFAEKRHDARTLRRLAAELLHRESSRANSLLIEVKSCLDEPELDIHRPETEVSQAPKYAKRLVDDQVADVFGEVSPIGAVKERDGPYPFSADGSVKRMPFSGKSGQIRSRLPAGEGAKWLHEVAELFGTSELNLHLVEIFLRVADADRAAEPLDSRELAKLVGVSTSTVSRNISHLGEWARENRPGMGLVTALPNSSDRRRKPIRLTAKGRQLLTMIENL